MRALALRSLLALLFVAALAVLLLGGGTLLATATRAQAPAAARTLNYELVVAGADGQEIRLPVMVYVPAGANGRQPSTVLVALHPFGGNGVAFGQPLVPYAEENGWILVAPTFPYRDWRDPEQVRVDEREFAPGLSAILRDLPARTGLALEPRALLYGFSRGAQAAHRFAFEYPELVGGVAAFSAGTYTLPQTTWKDKDAPAGSLPFPFGVSDLDKYCGKPFDLEAVRAIPFWIGVGDKDHNEKDVPRNWDKYLGDCRLDRADSFTQALRSAGISVEEARFANTDHTETAEVRAAALAFLRQVSER